MRKEAVVAVAVAAAAGCAIAAAVWYRRSSRRWRRADRVLRELRKSCRTPPERLWDVADAMEAEMRAGLADGAISSLKMLVCPILSFPTGNEEGLFYGLELGRTKVRVLRVQLGGKTLGVAKKELMEVDLPSYLMVGNSEQLKEVPVLQMDNPRNLGLHLHFLLSITLHPKGFLLNGIGFLILRRL